MECPRCESGDIRYVEIRTVRRTYSVQDFFEGRLEVMKENEIEFDGIGETLFECQKCGWDWTPDYDLSISRFEEVDSDEV